MNTRKSNKLGFFGDNSVLCQFLIKIPMVQIKKWMLIFLVVYIKLCLNDNKNFEQKLNSWNVLKMWKISFRKNIFEIHYGTIFPLLNFIRNMKIYFLLSI